MRLSPHSIAIAEPRPAATLASTKCAAALKTGGTPRDSAVTARSGFGVRRSAFGVGGSACMVLGSRFSVRGSRRLEQRDDLVRERLRGERLRVDTGDAIRRFADQAVRAALVDVEREA